MRLIGAEVLVEQLEQQEEHERKAWDKYNDESAFGRMSAFGRAISIVKKSQTIVEVDDEITKVVVKGVEYVKPEQKKDTIQKFHDYQIDWLKSHYDIELEPQLEEMIVRFMHDTANCYMMEEGESE